MSKLPFDRGHIPAGLLVPVHATLKGRVRWQVLDERGVPEVPRTPSGFAIAGAEGVHQDNLITNNGMDSLATQSALGVPINVDNWRRRLAVGTGSTAPAITDTTLVAEVQRVDTSGGFAAGANTYELDTVTNVWRGTLLATRVAQMTADRNLTEFGFAFETSGDIRVRELFRDGGGIPITISLLNGKSLRLDHSLIAELPAPAAGISTSIDVQRYNVGGTLESTTAYNVVHGGHVWTSDSLNISQVFINWDPSRISTAGKRALWVPKTYGRSGVWTASTDINPTSSTATPVNAIVMSPYVPGSYERIKRDTTGVAGLNGAWYGYAFTAITGSNFPENRSGWFVNFVSPATYVKPDTDTLRVGLVSSWARA